MLQAQLDLNTPDSHRAALAEATCNRVIGILKTMGHQSREVHLSDIALEILDETPFVAGNPYLFAGCSAGQPIKDCRIAFQNILRNAGIPNPEELVLHSRRHSVEKCLIPEAHNH